MAQRFLPRGSGKHPVQHREGKALTHERRAAALRVAFRRFPTVLPRSVKIHAMRCGRLHRGVIGVITNRR